MKSFCYSSFWAGRKIVQIEQTEPQGLPEGVRGTPKGEVCSKHKATKTEEIRASRISSLTICFLFFCKTKELCYYKSLPCAVCTFCYSPVLEFY